MPSLSCCGVVMKRKSNGVGVMEERVGQEEEEREEKRSRMEENGGKVGEEVKIATKCPICLWPAGAPECYHTAGITSQTGL